MNNKKFSRYRVINSLIVMAVLISFCSSGNVKGSAEKPPDVKTTYPEHIELMLKRISSFNNRSPGSISSSFEIVGKIKNKKFKSIGNIHYDRREGKLNATFLDYIFKSPVTMIFKENSSLWFYFPAEKKMILDNVNTIDLHNYLELNIDFNILFSLFSGEIPLIKGYKIKKGLSGRKGGSSYLILENQNFYQTISFDKSEPDRVLIIRKDSKEKCEIYFKKFFRMNGSSYYKKLRIISGDRKFTFDFIFKHIKLNVPVKVKTINKIRMPRGLKIIKMG